jgi:hypothetical protein
MAWISVHKEVIGTKLRLLAKKIGGSQNEALGILVRLWLWAMTEADRDGSLKCADKTDIAGVLANGLAENISPDNVVDSLVETEWLEFENGIYYIHDWQDWQKQWYQLQDKREYDSRRQREYRNRQRELNRQDKQEPAKEPEPVEVPKPEKPKRGKLDYTENFEAFWSVYPRKEGKGEAYKKYKARLNDGYTEQELIMAAENYARRCATEHTEIKYIKHAKTFLSDSTPFLDYLPKARDTAPAPAQYNGIDGLPSS